MIASNRPPSPWLHGFLLALSTGLYAMLVVWFVFSDSARIGRQLGCDMGVVCLTFVKSGFEDRDVSRH
jgi:hypothetical protein